MRKQTPEGTFEHPFFPEDISNNTGVKLSGLDKFEIPKSEIAEAVAEAPGARVRDGASVLATALEDASQLAIDQSIDILRMYANTQDEKTFGTVLRAKCAVIGHILSAKLRVSEESFRQQRFDRLPELLALVAEEEKRLPARLLIEGSALREALGN